MTINWEVGTNSLFNNKHEYYLIFTNKVKCTQYKQILGLQVNHFNANAINMEMTIKPRM